ncbi:MAG: T9SS type A sorting domain-containing protein, partial [Bacteroidales bacterium]|nr:T9SS type A sorting domain-containing protein [Bacteroidales bacterium]
VHTITYTYYDNNQCWNSCSFTIGVGPVIDAGPDTFIYIGDTYTFQPTAAGPTPMTYSWSPALTLIDPNVKNAVSWPIAPETFTLMVTDNTGCTATDQFFLDVRPRGNSLSGQVVYDNQAKTPMPGFGVIVTELGTMRMDTIITRFNGLFDIDSLPDGNYVLSGNYLQQWPWGGVNATDALLVARHFANVITLSPFRAFVGDVDGSNQLNTTDALRISQRFAGLIPSFAVVDWFLESDTIVFSGTPYLHTSQYLSLAAGDVNGSHVPFTKLGPLGKLEYYGQHLVNPGTLTSIPVTLNSQEPVGALSLQLILPEGLELKDVQMNEALGGELHYSLKGRLLNLAWVGLNAPTMGAEEPLMFLEIIPSAGSSSWKIKVGDVLEVADADGSVIRDARLSIPGLMTSDSPMLWARNYPNPFSDQTLVEYSIPVSGKVSLDVYNLLGDKLFTVMEEVQSAGEHTALIRANDLPTGSYYYQLSVDDGNTLLTHKGKLVIVR